MPKIGERYYLTQDPEENIYVVLGADLVSKRFWLGVENPDYDGYNFDLIMVQDKETGCYNICLADERCTLKRNQLKITKI